MGTEVAAPPASDELRFAFGRNWAEFLRSLDEERIATAVESLRERLGVADLAGRTFLDAGSGSGLFSLAARRLGARVHSFDYDAQSVGCTAKLREQFFPGDAAWTVEQGSVLDAGYLRRLGSFDVVYSWGVLHHTGAMWSALANVAALVAPGGTLFVSIYNDQGGASRRWRRVKRTYNRLPPPLRFAVLVPSLVAIWWKPLLRDALTLRPFASWRGYGGARGMSPWRDLVDWVGGYPFEVARPEEIFAFFRERGFVLETLVTHAGGGDCNEFVFTAPRG
jgi:2-polyprenyl-6-hydroxyphenyl methylase/3-demethylubiquinone-9 3-methyltransferase